MIVSSFIYVSSRYTAVSTEGSNYITVLRFGEHNRIQAIFQEGHLRTTDPRPRRHYVHESPLRYGQVRHLAPVIPQL